MSAAAKGSQEMMELLLMNKNLDIQIKNENQINSIWIACLYGHGVVMKVLAQAGVDIFCTNSSQVNILHLAVEKNYINIVEMLIDSGYPLDFETDEGMTAFQLAAYHGHQQIVEIIINFLKKQNNPELKDLVLNKVNPKSHLSTLAYSILQDNQKISKMLIEFGARSYYNETDKQMDLSPIFMAVQKQSTELLELMCDHEASLALKNSVGMTPLMFAAEQNYQSIVKFLSNRTTDLNEEDANNITILVHHLFSNNLKMASRLMVRGAKIDYVNKKGNTALHLCVQNKLKEAVEFLLFRGANPHIMDLNGEDACDKAKANGMAREIPEFNDCNITKKVIPLLPCGTYPDITSLNIMKKQDSPKSALLQDKKNLNKFESFAEKIQRG